jgi:hypothetical protein
MDAWIVPWMPEPYLMVQWLQSLLIRGIPGPNIGPETDWRISLTLAVHAFCQVHSQLLTVRNYTRDLCSWKVQITEKVSLKSVRTKRCLLYRSLHSRSQGLNRWTALILVFHVWSVLNVHASWRTLYQILHFWRSLRIFLSLTWMTEENRCLATIIDKLLVHSFCDVARCREWWHFVLQ